MAEAFGQNNRKVKNLHYHTFEQKDHGLPESSYNASKKLKGPDKIILNCIREGLGQEALKSEFSLFTAFAKDQFTRDMRGKSLS